MSRDHRIYHSSNHPWRTVGKIVAILLGLAVALTIFFYVWFQRYIHYTDNGLYLDIPWLEDMEETP